MRWIEITWGDATFHIATEGGQVVRAAPIAAWAIGQPERRAAAWFRTRGATFRTLAGQPGAAGLLPPDARWWCWKGCNGTHTMEELARCDGRVPRATAVQA